MLSNSRTEPVVYTENNDDLVCMRSNYRVQASILCAAQTDDKFCDVKLFGVPTDSSTANTVRPIHAHKVVLAYASKHLFELFTSDDFTDSHQSEYKIENVDHDSLRLIVEFIYTDKLVILKPDAVDLMRSVYIGAKYLLMHQLAEACETFLAGKLNLNNCVSLWSFARKYSCLALMHATSTFITEHLDDMPRNVEFLSMPYGDCAKLLLSEAFIAARADLRCSAAMAWLDYDEFGRISCMHDILNMIPFTPGSVSASTVLKANDCQLLQKNAPEVVRELMIGIFRRIDRNLPYMEQESSLPPTRTWYVIGGNDCSKSFLSYDVGQRLWSKLPSLSEDRQYFGACAVDDRLLAIRGATNSGYAMDIDEYCFENKLWSSGRMKLRQSRTYLAICRKGVYAYAIGGYIDYKTTNAVEQIDLESNEIISLAGMHIPRSSAVLDSNRDSIYAVGGWASNSRISGVEKYDISNNKWSRVGSLSVPRYGLATILLGDDLYTMGGYDCMADNCVEVFNVRTSQTRTASSLLERREGCRATIVNNGNVICVLGNVGILTHVFYM